MFSRLCTNHGGNGSSNFAAPDLSERLLIASELGFALGEAFGSKLDTPTADRLAAPAHRRLSAAAAIPEPAAALTGRRMAGPGFGRCGSRLTPAYVAPPPCARATAAMCTPCRATRRAAGYATWRQNGALAR
ncbi:MAG: hypothetical protein KDI53_09100 [Candidatus Accumulibacter sp.]|nr:hypothetical protein [Accumulibacter sp.]